MAGFMSGMNRSMGLVRQIVLVFVSNPLCRLWASHLDCALIQPPSYSLILGNMSGFVPFARQAVHAQ